MLCYPDFEAIGTYQHIATNTILLVRIRRIFWKKSGPLFCGVLRFLF